MSYTIEGVVEELRGALFMSDKFYLQAILDALVSKEGGPVVEGFALIPLKIWEAAEDHDSSLQIHKGISPKFESENRDEKFIAVGRLAGVEFNDGFDDDTEPEYPVIRVRVRVTR